MMTACPPVPPGYQTPGGPVILHVRYAGPRDGCDEAEQTAELCGYDSVVRHLDSCEQTLGVEFRIGATRAGTALGSPVYDIRLERLGRVQEEFVAVDMSHGGHPTTTHSSFTSCRYTGPRQRFPYVEHLRVEGTSCFSASTVAYFGADAYLQYGPKLSFFKLADGQRWSADLRIDVDGDDNQYVDATFRNGRATVKCDFIQQGQA